MLLTNRQTDRQTNTTENNLLCQGGNHKYPHMTLETSMLHMFVTYSGFTLTRCISSCCLILVTNIYA